MLVPRAPRFDSAAWRVRLGRPSANVWQARSADQRRGSGLRAGSIGVSYYGISSLRTVCKQFSRAHGTVQCKIHSIRITNGSVWNWISGSRIFISCWGSAARLATRLRLRRRRIGQSRESAVTGPDRERRPGPSCWTSSPKPSAVCPIRTCALNTTRIWGAARRHPHRSPCPAPPRKHWTTSRPCRRLRRAYIRPCPATNAANAANAVTAATETTAGRVHRQARWWRAVRHSSIRQRPPRRCPRTIRWRRTTPTPPRFLAQASGASLKCPPGQRGTCRPKRERISSRRSTRRIPPVQHLRLGPPRRRTSRLMRRVRSRSARRLRYLFPWGRYQWAACQWALCQWALCQWAACQWAACQWARP